MSKQAILSVYAKVLIGLFLVLLVTFSLLSINRYSASYEYQKSLLSKLRLSSQQLHAQLLEVRGGFVVDYDGMVEKVSEINNLLSSFASSNSLNSQLSEEEKSVFGGWLEGQKKIDISSAGLVAAQSSRAQVVEDFKSNFSVFRNSQLIVFQLIADLRQMHADNRVLNDDLDKLEANALKAIHAMIDENDSALDSSLSIIRERHRKSFEDIDEFLGFIIGHFKVINTRESIISDIVRDEVVLSKDFEEQLDVFEYKLDGEYHQHSQRSSMYRYGFGAVALIVLFYGIFQAVRSGRLASQLLVHNENLEEVVAKRTENLKLATDNLQAEQKEREKALIELKESREMLDAIINNLHGCVYEYDIVDDSVSYMSRGSEDIWGVSPREMSTKEDIRKYTNQDDLPSVCSAFERSLDEHAPFNVEYRVMQKSGNELWVREVGVPIVENGAVKSVVGLVSDINEFKKAGEDKKRIQEELHHAQKMESVGQLAAGVAHEINTPAQFISDNLVFLQESAGELIGLVKDIEAEVEKSGGESTRQVIGELLDRADMDYLADEVPQALSQSAGGIERIATIVRAMKDYSHPGESLEFADINGALQSTIIVSKSEWKYFAKLETAFDEDLPMVECVVGDINQVVLNMIVNAAHAIVDKFDDPDNLGGLITVRTKTLEEQVCIEISDNGAGMSESVKNRIFDQFFTTKEVGKGTGQGLSIAYRLIVENHGGKIDVESEPGEGATFRIVLPVSQSQKNKN
ncbi:ATP-binding protein [Porticoccus sp. W117]|uniref:ATP-binding protein n=1 Tax=Porticoccus sp. W117 TaxID=3054777 RepID=UPI0025979B0D|nr:ATP-binding protein [Porticoccus sp. W117]MDM3871721.1 ATP-binding protein [Porticoccus sp. W117]